MVLGQRSVPYRNKTVALKLTEPVVGCKIKNQIMGLTLHYRGHLTVSGQIDAITNEVIDICKSMPWAYQLVDLKMSAGIDPEVLAFLAGPGATNVHLRGVSFQVHPEAESFFLTFDTQQGRLLSPTSVITGSAYPALDDMFWLHNKTEFAGPDAHAITCRLLRYLSGRYFTHLDVLDESNYWETEDVGQLRQAFEHSGQLITNFTTALKKMDRLPLPTNVDELAERIELLFRRIIESQEGKHSEEE
jgi:hypothetical protein